MAEPTVVLKVNETDGETVADSADCLVAWWAHKLVVKMDIVWVGMKVEC